MEKYFVDGVGPKSAESSSLLCRLPFCRQLTQKLLFSLCSISLAFGRFLTFSLLEPWIVPAVAPLLTFGHQLQGFLLLYVFVISSSSSGAHSVPTYSLGCIHLRCILRIFYRKMSASCFSHVASKCPLPLVNTFLSGKSWQKRKSSEQKRFSPGICSWIGGHFEYLDQKVKGFWAVGLVGELGWERTCGRVGD